MQPVPFPVAVPQQQAAQQQAPDTPRGSVDLARERLAEIDNLTTLEQVEAFDAVHRLLQDSLAEVEQELRTEAPHGDGQGGQRLPGEPNPGQPGHNRHGKNRHGRR